MEINHKIKHFFENLRFLKRKTVKFEFRGDFYHLNNESSAKYHITHSVEKVHNMASLVPAKSNIVFDVGANCGLFSAMCFKKNANLEIHAFEPSKSLIKIIELNCKNFSKRLYLNNLALSDQEGEAVLYINKNSQQTNSLNRKSVEIIAELNQIIEQKTLCKTLDQYCMENSISYIDVLKLDVQGFEKHVVDGASKMLEFTEKIFLESSWLEIDTILLALKLREQLGFKYGYLINSVFAGADLLLSKEPLEESDLNMVISQL
ncbi:FkbM family methyltransferase [Sphaerothrix gracilis]|uniref:FkbM family methyltransferase n=1 Tax=Sphaerothrix gracilis TaxID=3151835 RepID=UPI0031FDA0F7